MKITLIMALSADGWIARQSKEVIDWTESADKKMFSQLTTQAGVVIMGHNTFQAMGRPLPNRQNIVLTRHPETITPLPDTLFTSQSPKEIIAQLQEKGCCQACVIGGGQINHLFASANLIDEIILTWSPTMFGYGIPLFSAEIKLDLNLVSLKQIGNNTVCAHYKVKK